MIKRPKQVERSQKSYLSNEKYQDYAEQQFKNIYDYLDEQEETKGIVVYENNSGSNENIVFSESIEDVKEIEIVYYYNIANKVYKSIRVPYTENMRTVLDINYYGTGSTVFFILSHLIEITNNGITKINEYTMQFANIWEKPAITDSANIYITKIKIYK